MEMIRIWRHRRDLAILLAALLVFSVMPGTYSQVNATPALAVTQVEHGNIFVEEAIALDIDSSGDTIAWHVYDAWDQPLQQGQQAVTATPFRLTLPIDDPGYYKIVLQALQSGGMIAEAETRAAILTEYDFSGAVDSPFGVNAHFYLPDRGYVADEVAPLIRIMGAKSVRATQLWSDIEKQREVYDFTVKNGAYETYMEELEQNGLDPLLSFGSRNPLYDGYSTPYSNDGREGYARFTGEVVKHFGEQVTNIGSYNEFSVTGDLGNGPADNRPDYYLSLFKAVYEAVKTDPLIDWDVQLNGGEVGGEADLPWLEELFEINNGEALGYMDNVAVHPYRSYPKKVETLDGYLPDLDTLIRQYNNGQPKPIWMTEIGRPTTAGPNHANELEQASEVVRTYAIALSHGVSKIHWYDFMNLGTDRYQNMHNYGLIYNRADPLGAYVPKPGYVSYAVTARQLTGTQYVEREQLGQGLYSVVFRDGNQVPVRVLWSLNGPTTVTLETYAPVEITTMTGREETYTPYGGEIVVTATVDPVFVRGEIDSIAQGGNASLVGTTGVTGEDVPFALTVEQVSAPTVVGFETVAGSYTFPAAPGSPSGGEVLAPAVAVEGVARLEGDLTIQGQKAGYLVGFADVGKPFLLEAEPRTISIADGEQALRLKVTNYSTRQTYTLGDVDWTWGSRSGSAATGASLPPDSVTTVDVPLPPLPFTEQYALEVTAQVVGKPALAYANSKWSFNPIARQTVQLDGTADGGNPALTVSLGTYGSWVGINSAQWGGAGDLSGTIRLNWDDDYLYVTAEAIDDTFHQTENVNFWMGDSLQFALSPGMPATGSPMYEYGAALTPQGVKVTRTRAPAGETTGTVTGAAAIVRNETAKTTTYEIALPWSAQQLLTHSGNVFSFSLLVNDNDGSGRKGWYEWGGGVGSGKDPGKFKAVQTMAP